MRNLLCAAALGVATLAAGNAGAAQNWYAGLEGGITFPEKSHFFGETSTMDGDATFKDGYMIGGVMGYDFGGFRAEGELVYRRNSAKDVTFINDAGLGVASGVGPLHGEYSAGGHSDSFAGMVNGYYDIGTDWVVHPYIGVGIGLAGVKFSDVNANGAVALQGSKTEFAYQGIVGLRWAISDQVGMSFDYRYFATGHVDVGDGLNDSVRADKYRSHTLSLGLHYNFGMMQ